MFWCQAPNVGHFGGKNCAQTGEVEFEKLMLCLRANKRLDASGRQEISSNQREKGKGWKVSSSGNEDPTSHLLTRKAHTKNAAGSIALFGLTVLLLAINGIAMHAICPTCNEQCIELMV